ncbi:organic cation transporter protein-like [Pecten maximus]|uniref:organic cation transporter protein-like n=1 Tax=Pecten maximus TaxID=6579 RepID=UPI001457F134|nr:organic cation transporter protein-like [Pecten maximus]
MYLLWGLIPADYTVGIEHRGNFAFKAALTKSNSTMVNLDELIPKLGGFGYYQKRLYILLTVPIAVAGMFMIMMVFALYTPNHSCKRPHDSSSFNDSRSGRFTASECTLRQEGDEQLNSSNASLSNISRHITPLPCSEWDYDDDVFKKTFTTTHNLVCQESLKISHAQMIFYFGVVIGDILFGQLSDLIGRKKTLIIAMFILLVSGLSGSFSPEYYSFVVIQFVVGTACKGCLVLAFVMGFEFVGPDMRVWLGQALNIIFALALCSLCGLGILIKDWQYIQITCTIPTVLFILLWFVLDESPRWLLSKGRTEEAKSVLLKIARTNKVTPDGNLLQQLEHEKSTHTEKISSLFKNRTLAIRTLVVFFNWFGLGMTYYGVFLHAENLGGNFYLAIFLLSVIEIPILLVNLYLLNKFGRRRVHCLTMMTGGLACICSIFPVIFGGEELQPLILALAVIGKMGASGAFGSIYVISGEVFPTIVRNGAVGASSSFARIGSMLAPYIAKLGTVGVGSYGKAIPLIVFGACSITAGLFALLLPETMGCRLPDTIEEAVDFKLLREDPNTESETEELRSMIEN